MLLLLHKYTRHPRLDKPKIKLPVSAHGNFGGKRESLSILNAFIIFFLFSPFCLNYESQLPEELLCFLSEIFIDNDIIKCFARVVLSAVGTITLYIPFCIFSSGIHELTD